jgi:hypothetical protein
MDVTHCRPFRLFPLGNTTPGISSQEKYNPKYIFQSMIPLHKIAKLGTMKTTNKGTGQEDKKILTAIGHSNFFEIRVRGQLDESWSDWLEGLEAKLLKNGEMMLYGYIEDQAALMGILNKLYRLNLTILSLEEIKQRK